MVVYVMFEKRNLLPQSNSHPSFNVHVSTLNVVAQQVTLTPDLQTHKRTETNIKLNRIA